MKACPPVDRMSLPLFPQEKLSSLQITHFTACLRCGRGSRGGSSGGGWGGGSNGSGNGDGTGTSNASGNGDGDGSDDG